MITKLAHGRSKEVKGLAVGTYEITHEKIMESGKKLFLENGYERTNLRELCKGAGITTGAFYRHFEDKAALFSALVEPAVTGLREKYDAAESKSTGYIVSDNMDDLWSISTETMAEFIDYIFKHFDSFKLLLHCADGTKYVDFTDWMVEREVADTFKMYETMETQGISCKHLSKKELHMLYHAYYSCIFETVLHDYQKAEALQCTHTLAEFFTAGWRKAHGL